MLTKTSFAVQPGGLELVVSNKVLYKHLTISVTNWLSQASLNSQVRVVFLLHTLRGSYYMQNKLSNPNTL